MRVSVVVVNHNTREHLRACLATIERDHCLEVIVVDNASFDGSPEMVAAEFPWVQLVANEENLGYGSAANDAIERTTSDVVLLLNSDTILQSGALDRIERFMCERPRVAILGPRLENVDGTLQISCHPFPGTADWLLDNEVAGSIVRRIPYVRRRSFRAWSHKRPRAVPWIKGAALAIRRCAFDEVGGFDRDFFLYYEETDLCYRLWAAGWRVVFAPVTTVLHVGGASTARYRTAMAVQLFESRIKFYRLHYSSARQLLLLAVWKTIVSLRLVRDRLRLLAARDTLKRAAIEADLAAWRSILSGSGRQFRV